MEMQFVTKNGDVVLEEAYSVATGTVLTINTKEEVI
jgi:aconitate hydratase 2/2-methylisocitrate dehydratase